MIDSRCGVCVCVCSSRMLRSKKKLNICFTSTREGKGFGRNLWIFVFWEGGSGRFIWSVAGKFYVGLGTGVKHNGGGSWSC